MSSKHHEPRAEGEGHPFEADHTDVTSPGAPAAPDSAAAAQATPEPGGAKPAPGSSGPISDAAVKMATLEAELAALREELSVVNDKYLRKLADDVNFRKRMAREKEDGQRYAVATLLGDVVPVLDDFDRAISSAETCKDYTVLHDGIVLIRRQLGQMLENKYGLQRFTSLGQPFDPYRHEAVAMVEAAPDEEGPDEAVVSEEFLPGYGLHDRILRTAKVRVRMPSAKAPGASGEASGA